MSKQLTGEVIAEALRQAGLDVQYFPWVQKEGQPRTPHTVGSFSLDKIAAAVNVHLAQLDEPSENDSKVIEAARDLHESEGTIEIYPEGPVSYSSDGGAYVHAKVWVDDDAIRAAGASNPETGLASTVTRLPGDPVRALEVDISEGGHCD